MALGGENAGRILSLAVALATLATFALHQRFGIEAAQPFVLIVDVSLLAVGAYLAMLGDSYWPIWFCGFHSISVATGLARFAFPARLPTLYTNLGGFWALPALGVTVAGILLDRRAKQSR